jgi:hypothetical protein
LTVSHIIVILSECDLFDNFKILDINIEPPVQSIKARAYLKNGQMLQISESNGEDFRRYSYHLQDGDRIIKRWDNAPHWNKVKTHPFHAHVCDQKEPVESKEMFISDVIAEITNICGNKNRFKSQRDTS